jgi:hypothetical protein
MTPNSDTALPPGLPRGTLDNDLIDKFSWGGNGASSVKSAWPLLVGP